MKLLSRKQDQTADAERERPSTGDAQSEPSNAPAREEAPQPQPERAEPKLRDPGLSKLSGRDYVAIVKRAGKEAMDDHITNIAAALAYYAFLAIPSALLVAVGIFSLVAGPDTINSLVDKLGTVMPSQATSLIKSNLTNMTHRQATGIAIIGVGGLLAVWSLGGAMQNVMWALNVAYDRDETRGFVKRRLTSWLMLACVLLAFGLSFGLLVLGPHLSHWVGNAVGQTHLVSILWWAAQWPVLIIGLLFAFAGVLYLGPNVDHPRWRFLTLGAAVAVVIWLAASGLFAFYTSKFGSYNKTWGALAAVVILLTWFWLSGVALLFGAEVNAEAERSRELRRGEPAEVELQAPAKA
jgi:membrane protein